MGITIAQWKPDYESGDSLVDEQHKSLFSTINALNNALLEGCGETLLRQTLASLKDYTTVHFETEEQYMLEHGYPGSAEHHSKHEALKARVAELEREQQQNLPQLTIAVSHFLVDWLIHHIKDEDFKMIRFCREGKSPNAVALPDLPTPDRPGNLVIAQWRPEYETGYTLIDDQHRSLFHAINALNNAMMAGRAEELLDRTLKTLRNYTTIHFETEEQFMLKYGYPGYTEHQAKHEQLRNHVGVFSQQEKQHNAAQLTISVSHFLTDWLISHIKDEDQKMIRFLRQERQKEQEIKTAAST